MPAGHLSLYRFIEDAWSGGLCAWCRDGGGETSWLVVENAGQTRWLFRKFAKEGVAGIRVFDAGGLRDELARLAGFDPLPRDLANVAFAIKVAAHQEAGEAAESAARNAPALADACDVLARAGWHLNQLGVDPSIARRLHRTLGETGLLPGIFDRRLREGLPAKLPVRLCCVGWDATHWGDLGLLGLAAEKAASCDVYVPSPRLPADAQQRKIPSIQNRL